VIIIISNELINNLITLEERIEKLERLNNVNRKEIELYISKIEKFEKKLNEFEEVINNKLRILNCFVPLV